MIRFIEAEPVKARPTAPASAAKPADVQASDGAVPATPSKRGRPRKEPRTR